MTRTLSWKTRAALALATSATLVATTAVAAQAGSMWFSRSSGRIVTASWLEVGELPGNVPGNIHFGSMSVEDLGEGAAAVFGEVYDLTCPEGVIPEDPWGGGHGDEGGELDNGCVHEGVRWIEGGDVTFTLDKRLAGATLTGNLDVYGHDGDPAGSPAVNISWTGTGDTYKSTITGRDSDGSSSYQYRYAFSGRAATTTGNMGAMVFDDAEGEWSLAEMGTYRQLDKSRQR